MRVLICLIPLLGACSAAQVHCDAHLVPINPPAAVGSSDEFDQKKSLP